MIRPWEIHPALVHFPIAFLTGGVALDAFAWWRKSDALARTATGLIIAGTLTGALTGLAGLLAFYTVPAHTEDAHTLMWWHLVLNVLAIAIWAGLSTVRWRSRVVAPSNEVRLIGIMTLAVTLFSAYLGGEIVYKGGAGIDPSILSPALQHHHHGGPEAAPADQPHTHVHDEGAGHENHTGP